MSYSYAIVMDNQTVSAAAILIGIRPGTATGFRVLRAWAAQRGSATSAQVGIQLGRKTSAFPTTLTGATPVKMDEKDAASAFTGGTSLAAGTCGTLATAEGAGAFTPVISDNFNNLTGWVWVPGHDEEMVFRAGSADACVLRFPATPSPTGNWSAGLIIQEI